MQNWWEREKAESWKVKAFTDNVVLGLPVFADGEVDLGLAFLMISQYQLSMVKHGFFVRGAIAVGELYMDDQIVFGDALIEAYEGESQLARDPRVVLTKSAEKLVRSHIRYYGEIQHSPQYQELLIDNDGQVFVHYLGAAFDEDDRSPCVDILTTHRSEVESLLKQFSDRPNIWSKYAWAARYHNWTCADFGPDLAGSDH